MAFDSLLADDPKNIFGKHMPDSGARGGDLEVAGGLSLSFGTKQEIACAN